MSEETSVTEKPCYTMHDLCQIVGVTPAMVHRWRAMGLVPPAYTRRQLAWGPVHVRQLKRVKEIRDRNRTLTDIRDMTPTSEDSAPFVMAGVRVQDEFERVLHMAKIDREFFPDQRRQEYMLNIVDGDLFFDVRVTVERKEA